MRRAIRERRTLDDALALSAGRRLAEGDFALARAIATVTFRRMGTIRAALEARLKDGKLPDAGILAEAILTGAAQILFMEVADHAAVDLAVELAKSDRLALHYAPLVNAILRRIIADRADILDKAQDGQADLPGWLADRWRKAYGDAAVDAIARLHILPPHVDLSAMDGDPTRLASDVEGVLLPSGSVRLTTQAAVVTLPGYAEGRFQVQDAASALPARLIDAKPGQSVLDLCAAPGGKTAQLAVQGARVVAVERSAQRAERLKENLLRLRLDVEVVVADAGAYEGGPFDAVLLDAPCSATGTLRRHPEIAWTKRLEDILALSGQQQRLLDQAAKQVRPGGVLVYSTCSLEPEEGERQVLRWLDRNSGFAVLPVNPDALGVEGQSVTTDGFLRVLPCHFGSHGGMDGFFAARLHRLA